MPTGPGFPVSDEATEMNTYIIAISDAVGGMYGGFDPTMALATDLQQQVSSAGGLPLDNEIPAAYPTLFPGYSNASYDQAPQPGSPEGDMATTLGTLQGTLQTGADQQNSQPAELARLQMLETENAAAVGVLQALEVGNEIGIFASEQDLKLRNATNAQLNALVVAESNRENKQAQDELESLAIVGQHSDWNLGDGNMQEQDPQIPNQ
jgi:P-type conjugative transfer protein TrbJ